MECSWQSVLIVLLCKGSSLLLSAITIAYRRIRQSVAAFLSKRATKKEKGKRKIAKLKRLCSLIETPVQEDTPLPSLKQDNKCQTHTMLMPEADQQRQEHRQRPKQTHRCESQSPPSPGSSRDSPSCPVPHQPHQQGSHLAHRPSTPAALPPRQKHRRRVLRGGGDGGGGKVPTRKWSRQGSGRTGS